MPERQAMNGFRVQRRQSRRQTRMAIARWHTLLASGLPAGEAMQTGASAGGPGSELLERAARSVTRGRPLWLALSRAGFVLDSAEIALVRAGEASGQLQETLGLLRQLLEREASERGRLWQAAVYPAGLLAVTVAVVCTLATWVLPAFAAMYADAGATLPTSTRLMMEVADFLLHRGHQLTTIVVVAVASWLAARRGWRGFAQKTDRILLEVPVLGRLVRCMQAARVYGLLAAMLDARTDLESALALALPTLSNLHLRAELDRSRTLVRNGEPLSSAVRRSSFDPSGTDAGLLRAAEATGSYADAFARLARMYDGERDLLAARLLGAVEPGAIAVMATVIGTTVLAVYQPVLGSAAVLTKTIP